MRKSVGQMKAIRRAVEKYNGLVEISHRERVFSVALTMYVEKGECPVRPR